MYQALKVIKFNNDYFEDGDVIMVKTKDKRTIIGSVVIDSYSGSVSDSHSLALDTSEQYHQKRTFIHPKDILDIQKHTEITREKD